jgi:hypothetical protein
VIGEVLGEPGPLQGAQPSAPCSPRRWRRGQCEPLHGPDGSDVGLASLRTRTGCSQTDKEGNLGPQSGYKGHPMCGFCRQRFYDDGALYSHMQREHYTCHICQRADPSSFVYYHDYNKLEQHFRSAHHLCEDPQCLAKRFVVFQTEMDAKRHAAQEHGSSMSKAQRREALTLPVNFQYASSRPAAMERDSSSSRGFGRGSGSSAAAAADGVPAAACPSPPRS